jgi:hypothetical protein
MLTQQYKKEYMLIQNQKSMTIDDDNSSMASTLIPNTTSYEKSMLPKRSNSVNRLCRRISSSIKRNFQEGMQNRKESRKEKRPQDGKTNPME